MEKLASSFLNLWRMIAISVVILVLCVLNIISIRAYNDQPHNDCKTSSSSKNNHKKQPYASTIKKERRKSHQPFKNDVILNGVRSQHDSFLIWLKIYMFIYWNNCNDFKVDKPLKTCSFIMCCHLIDGLIVTKARFNYDFLILVVINHVRY